jgi:hypothetical protein
MLVYTFITNPSLQTRMRKGNKQSRCYNGPYLSLKHHSHSPADRGTTRNPARPQNYRHRFPSGARLPSSKLHASNSYVLNDHRSGNHTLFRGYCAGSSSSKRGLKFIQANSCNCGNEFHSKASSQVLYRVILSERGHRPLCEHSASYQNGSGNLEGLIAYTL